MLLLSQSIQRVRERLGRAQSQDKLLELKFTFPDLWARRLFVALCRRYELAPYRYKRQRYTTVMLRAPRSLIDVTIWPEFSALHRALSEYLNAATVEEYHFGRNGEILGEISRKAGIKAPPPPSGR